MSRFTKRVAVWVAALLVIGFIQGLNGCGDDGDDGAGPGTSGSGTTIGAAGGTVASADGDAVLRVPAGALSQDVVLTIVPAPSPPAGALSGTAYDFGPTGTAFAAPATLSLAYDPATLPAGVTAADLCVSRAASGVWNPLAGCVLDSAAATVSAPTSHLSIYGVTTGGSSGGASDTAYVKDAPAVGAENEFDSFSAAVAWLNGHLSAGDLGVVVWQTSTEQAVSTLSFLFDLEVDVDAGHTAILRGPASDPLTIDAAGAVHLNDFEIRATGGFVLNANRNLTLGGCTLPDVTTVNIGGVKDAPFPASVPGYVDRSAAATRRAKGATIFANHFGREMNVNFTSAGTIEGNYKLENNGGETLRVGGTATFIGSSVVEVCKTPGGPPLVPIPYPVIATQMDGDSKVKVTGLKQVQVLSCNCKMNGRSTMTVGDIAGTSADIKIYGTGAPQIKMTKSVVSLCELSAGTPFVKVLGDSVTVATMKLKATSDKAPSEAQIQLTDAEISETLEVDFMASSDGEISITLDDSDFQNCWLYVPEGADASLSVMGGNINGMLHFGPNTKRRGASAARATRGTVSIDELTWSGSGTDHVDLNRFGASVSITNSNFSYSGIPALALGLSEISGALTVTGNNFTNFGLGVVDCQGSATIEDNTISVTDGAGYGISLGNSASTTIQSCTLSCGGGGANAIQAGDMNGSVSIAGCSVVGGVAALIVGNSNVICDNNALLTGMITIAAGQLHISGNTCSGVQLIDDYADPGLMNDPVADNDGLLPGEVMTRKDWDGNGCCDYPPEWNVKEDGVCVCDGVPGK